MRSAPVLSLVLAVLGAGACRTTADQSIQTAFQVPQRDLTLERPGVPDTAIASPVELSRVPPAIRTTRHVRQARRAARSEAPDRLNGPETPVATAPTPAPMSVAPSPATAPSDPPDPHALAPGQTVTVIPVSSGATADAAPAGRPAPEGTDQPPSDAPPRLGPRGHGGGCHGSGGRPGGVRGFR
jgi:hypothetical protein